MAATDQSYDSLVQDQRVSAKLELALAYRDADSWKFLKKKWNTFQYPKIYRVKLSRITHKPGSPSPILGPCCTYRNLPHRLKGTFAPISVKFFCLRKANPTRCGSALRCSSDLVQPFGDYMFSSVIQSYGNAFLPVPDPRIWTGWLSMTSQKKEGSGPMNSVRNEWT